VSCPLGPGLDTTDRFSIPYTSPVPNSVGIENIANMDPSAYMSPLDLYESIWWGRHCFHFQHSSRTKVFTDTAHRIA
jgi:hypothetical protein